MIKSITPFLIIFFIFQQLKSQISQIDQNGYNPFCDETLHISNTLYNLGKVLKGSTTHLQALREISFAGGF